MKDIGIRFTKQKHPETGDDVLVLRLATYKKFQLIVVGDVSKTNQSELDEINQEMNEFMHGR